MLCIFLLLAGDLLSPKAEAVKAFEASPEKGIWRGLTYVALEQDGVGMAGFARDGDQTNWSVGWGGGEGERFVALVSELLLIGWEGKWTISMKERGLRLKVSGHSFDTTKDVSGEAAVLIIQGILLAGDYVYAVGDGGTRAIDMTDFRPAFEYFQWKYKTFVEGVKF